MVRPVKSGVVPKQREQGFQTDSTEAINDSSANLILFYDYHLTYFLPLLFTFSSHNEKGSELY